MADPEIGLEGARSVDGRRPARVAILFEDRPAQDNAETGAGLEAILETVLARHVHDLTLMFRGRARALLDDAALALADRVASGRLVVRAAPGADLCALPEPLRAAVAAPARGGAPGIALAVDYDERRVLADHVAALALRTEPRWEIAATTDEVAPALATAIEHGMLGDLDLAVIVGASDRFPREFVWSGAYAELVLLDRCWRSVTVEDVDHALGAFAHRKRRFGGVAPI